MKSIICILINLIFVYSIDWTNVDNVINEAIYDGVFSGAVLAVVSQNSTFLKKAYGTTTPTRGLYATPVTVDMKFDINLLSQVVGTGTCLMQMYDTQTVSMSKRIASSLPDFNNNGKGLITLDNMMSHNSGIQAQYNDAFGKNTDQLLKNIEKIKLQYATEAKFLYSEVGYVILGHMIAKIKNQTLKDAFFQIMVEAGLRDTTFHPSSPLYQIVPGGYNQGVCRGIPYNKYAHFMDYMSGNSGLFSTADNLVRLMQLLLNKGKMPLQLRLFSQDVINNFTTPTVEKKYNNTFAKGWETVPSSNPPCGSKFSKNSFGLADTSGSYMWADKDKHVAIVLLANGNFPVQKSAPPTSTQAKISDAIMTALGY